VSTLRKCETGTSALLALPVFPQAQNPCEAGGRRVQGRRKPIAPATPLGALDAVTGSDSIEREKDGRDPALDCVWGWAVLISDGIALWADTRRPGPPKAGGRRWCRPAARAAGRLDRVFVGRDGRPMRGDAVRQAFNRARVTAGMPGFRFHDLRHTGQTLAAATGATVRDLMRRLGHASPVASYRYLHAVDGRDAEIAAALSDLAAHGDVARLPKSIVVKH
jgi:hypothetical protein